MSKPVTKYIIDQYGFERRRQSDYETFMANYYRVLTKRAIRWNKKVRSGTVPSAELLKRFIRKGVPSDRRITVWMTCSGAERLRTVSALDFAHLSRSFVPNALTESIKIDLPRTFPDNIHFQDENSRLRLQLYNVLCTFATQCPSVGYCQGLNYIVGLLLLVTANEEVSFWLLKALVETILPQYYVANMCGLLTDLDVLNDLVQALFPRLHRHLKGLGLQWAMATTKWFICLYVECLPTETVLRIWDCLFSEGSRVIFCAALALIHLHKATLMTCTELGELLTCFKQMGQHAKVLDCHQFIVELFKYSKACSISKIRRLRQKYQH